ncbi:ATP-dependent DNA helicase rep [Lachnospiraceae bacterium KM106-2]|nr:ATP-dependent DNA helicase rep [Lachnospiraceae bacterium KM106-2]
MSVTVEEEFYLKLVLHRLNGQVDQMKEKIEQWKTKIQKQKEFLWDNTSDMDEEERLENKQSIEQDVMLLNAYQRYYEQLQRLKSSPYFGKIRFSYEEDGAILPVYIGIMGFYDRKEDQSYIYDWRAPISSLYYEYEMGKASFEAPDGIIRGTIEEKKQFQIQDGTLKYMIDTNLRIDDEVLLQQLSNHNEGRMRQVVATIQKEQNRIIREDKVKTLIINGTAGSGKTVVALHRVAWLLYNHRKQLRSDNIMILSPNALFSDYISEVLPELGEENVIMKEWDDLMADMLLIEDPYEYKNDQINYILNCEDEEDPRYQRIVLKSSTDYYHQLNAFLKNKRADNEAQLIALYLTFLKEVSIIEPGMEEYQNEFGEICYEDILAVFYMQVKLLGAGAFGSIRHLLIDEMQDYTIFQYAILNTLFSCSKTILGDENQVLRKGEPVTKILQAIYPEASMIEMNQSYRSTKEINDFANQILSITNTQNVNRHGKKPEVLEFESKEQMLRQLQEKLGALKDTFYESIAILCDGAEESYQWYEWIQEKCDVTLIKETTTVYPEGILVLPAYLSKGLEFDAVIILKTQDCGIEEVRRQTYYIEATRALHELCVYQLKDES